MNRKTVKQIAAISTELVIGSTVAGVVATFGPSATNPTLDLACKAAKFVAGFSIGGTVAIPVVRFQNDKIDEYADKINKIRNSK